jgi:3-methyladenine DNA glycosylase/8-oxoguanine DNA glycosylase
LLLGIRQPKGKGRPLRISVDGACRGPGERLRIASRVRRILNLDLDLSAFYSLCRKERRLHYVPEVGAGRFLSAGNVFEDVLKTICATNISWRQAVVGVNRIAETGRAVHSGRFRAFPSAEEILSLGAERLSRVSRLGYRVPSLLEWSERVASRDSRWLDAEERLLDREELRRFFLSIRGVGPTSCHYLLMMRGMARDVPIDSSVYLYLKENRFAGRTPTRAQILRLYERFGDWKAYAYWFEFLPWARDHWAFDHGEGTEAQSRAAFPTLKKRR